MTASRPATLGLCLALLGCAHGPPPGPPGPGGPAAAAPSLPPGHPPIADGPRQRPGPEHGRRPFPFPLRDGRTGAPLSSASLTARLEAARVVYAGERHTDPATHDVQLAILGRLFALDRSVAVGLEMLPREAQPHLDAYLAGQLDEEALLAAVRWDDTWGHDFALYRPLFAFCRAHGLRIHSLNAAQEIVRAVRRGGIEGLTAAQRAALPDGYPWPQPEPHRAYLREVFSRHPSTEVGGAGARTEDSFARFYLAQLVWDETMAETVARVLKAPDAPRRLLVLAGTGHVGRYAVPMRAARRGAEPSLSILPTDEREGPPPGGASAADLLVVTE